MVRKHLLIVPAINHIKFYVNVRGVIMKKNIIIFSFIILIGIAFFSIYRLNKYETYFLKENESSLKEFCRSVINNQEIYIKTDYQNITVEQLNSISIRYNKEIISYSTLENRYKSLTNSSRKQSIYLTVQGDIHYYINKELLNSVFYDNTRTFPQKIEITNEYKKMYQMMVELNNLYYNFIFNELIDTDYYNETGNLKFIKKISCSYWNKKARNLDIMIKEYLD